MSLLVSIIVPIYNSEKYLRNCLDSIQQQTYKNIEVLLINDGSTDNSVKICEEYLCDLRFHLISKKNEGVSCARNLGIELAKGYFIQFTDSDDILEKNLISTLVCNILETEADLCVCGIKSFFVNINQIDSVWVEKQFIHYKEDFLHLITKWTLNPYIGGPYNKLFLSKIIKNNKIFYERGEAYGEDIVFNLKYMMFCHRISCVDSSYYFYRRDSTNSLTRFKWNSQVYLARSLMIYDHLSMLCEQSTSLQSMKKEFYYDLLFRYIKKYYRNTFTELKKSIKDLCIDFTLDDFKPYHKYLLFFINAIDKKCFLIAILYVKLLTILYNFCKLIKYFFTTKLNFTC